MHQRTAAGVAAATEKKIANLEIMGSANKKPSKADIIHAAAIHNNQQQQQQQLKKSSLHQIMNTPDELKQASNNNHWNYV
jgi:hypothetical protein